MIISFTPAPLVRMSLVSTQVGSGLPNISNFREKWCQLFLHESNPRSGLQINFAARGLRAILTSGYSTLVKIMVVIFTGSSTVVFPHGRTVIVALNQYHWRALIS